MNAETARAMYQRRLDALGQAERERAIQQIHDRLAHAHREKIEHIFAEYRRQHGVKPVIVLVDVLYDEFGERVGLSTHGPQVVTEIQEKAYNADGFAALIYAFSPDGARDLLAQGFSEKEADAALLPSPPGKTKLFICSMGALSGYDVAAEVK